MMCKKDFASKFFFVCCGSCVQSVIISVARKISSRQRIIRNAHIVRHYRQVFFSTKIFSGWILDFQSCVAVCLRRSWEFFFISRRHISHIVATRLRCGGIFNYRFIANLSQSLTMKEFWQSVKTCWNYWHKFTATFFLRNTVYRHLGWLVGWWVGCLVGWLDDGWLEFNVPFQHKYGYIRDVIDVIPNLSSLFWMN